MGRFSSKLSHGWLIRIRYYKAYLAFFTDAVQLKGTSAALEQYLFSEGANRDPSIDSDEKQPQMFTRLLSGLLHPLIHVGYGVEFGNPGMVIEGGKRVPHC